MGIGLDFFLTVDERHPKALNHLKMVLEKLMFKIC